MQQQGRGGPILQAPPRPIPGQMPYNSQQYPGAQSGMQQQFPSQYPPQYPSQYPAQQQEQQLPQGLNARPNVPYQPGKRVPSRPVPPQRPVAAGVPSQYGSQNKYNPMPAEPPQEQMCDIGSIWNMLFGIKPVPKRPTPPPARVNPNPIPNVGSVPPTAGVGSNQNQFGALQASTQLQEGQAPAPYVRPPRPAAPQPVHSEANYQKIMEDARRKNALLKAQQQQQEHQQPLPLHQQLQQQQSVPLYSQAAPAPATSGVLGAFTDMIGITTSTPSTPVAQVDSRDNFEYNDPIQHPATPPSQTYTSSYVGNREDNKYSATIPTPPLPPAPVASPVVSAHPQSNPLLHKKAASDYDESQEIAPKSFQGVNNNSAPYTSAPMATDSTPVVPSYAGMIKQPSPAQVIYPALKSPSPSAFEIGGMPLARKDSEASMQGVRGGDDKTEKLIHILSSQGFSCKLVMPPSKDGGNRSEARGKKSVLMLSTDGKEFILEVESNKSKSPGKKLVFRVGDIVAVNKGRSSVLASLGGDESVYLHFVLQGKPELNLEVDDRTIRDALVTGLWAITAKKRQQAAQAQKM